MGLKHLSQSFYPMDRVQDNEKRSNCILVVMKRDVSGFLANMVTQ